MVHSRSIARKDLNNDRENDQAPSVIDPAVIDLADVQANGAGNMASVREDPAVASVSPVVARATQVAFQLVGLRWGRAFFKMLSVRRLKASAMNQVQVAVQVEADQDAVDQDAVDQAVEIRVKEMQDAAASRGSSHRAARPKEAHEVQVDDRSEEVAVRRSTNVREIVTEVATEKTWAAEITVANAEAEILVAIAPVAVASAAVVRVVVAPVEVGLADDQEEEADLEDDPVVVGLADVLEVAMAVVLDGIGQVAANSCESKVDRGEGKRVDTSAKLATSTFLSNIDNGAVFDVISLARILSCHTTPTMPFSPSWL